MLMEKVVDAAMPYLAGHRVVELVVGLSLIGCALDDGRTGVSYVMREGLPNGCSAFPFAQETEGREASEIARWVYTGGDDVQRAIGAAVLDAASQGLDIPDDDSDLPFGIPFTPQDRVGMVGYIRPVAARIQTLVKEVVVFDHGVYLRGGDPMVRPTDEQSLLLPTCDVVILSGTTTVNGTIDGLLKMCRGAREVVLVGTSTPMFPEGFAGTKVTRLAGAWWDNERRREIFKRISLAAGINSMSGLIRMKNARVY